MADVLELFLFCLYQATLIVILAAFALLCVMSVFPISGIIYHHYGSRPFRGAVTSLYFIGHLILAMAFLILIITEFPG